MWLGTGASNTPFARPIQGSGVGFGLPPTLAALAAAAAAPGGHAGVLEENVGGCGLDGKAGWVVMGEKLWLKDSCRGADGEADGTHVIGYCFVGKIESGTELYCNGYIEVGIWWAEGAAGPFGRKLREGWC